MKTKCLLFVIATLFFIKTSNVIAYEDFGVPQLLSLPNSSNEEDVKLLDDTSNKIEEKVEPKPEQTKTDKPLETEEKDIPTEEEDITIFLPPENTPIEVPNFEHIPYFFSDIQILPDGDVKITETIIFIVKGNIIKTGINRLFSKEIYNRLSQPIKGDVNIVSVVRNGNLENFNLRKTKQGILLTTGNKNILLEKGVHTYEISYIARRQVSMFNKLDDFFWNLTGANWNLVITRVGARIRPPLGARVIEQKGFLILRDGESKEFFSFNDSDGNIIFGAKRHLGLGEAFILLVSWPKGYIITPSIQKKITHFIKDNGDALIGFFGFITIFLSYLMSWLFFKQKASNKNIKSTSIPPKNINSSILRFLTNNSFDAKDFASCLIFTAQKNGIIIEETEANSFVIIKRSEKNKKLSKSENLIIETLFPNKQTRFEVNNNNALMLKKSMIEFFNSLVAENKKLIFEHNKPYLFLGIAMFAITILAMAYLSIQPWFTLIVSASLGFLMIITFSLFFYFLKILNHKKTKLGSTNINDLIISEKAGFIKKSAILTGSLIFGVGSYFGVLLYIEATSLYSGVAFTAIAFAIGLFCNIFKNKIVLKAMINNHILGYKKFLNADGNITPPITKEIASKNQTIFNHHLPYVIAFDLENTWSKKFMPLNEVDFNNQSYKPFWYSGEREFKLKNLANDLSSLINDLTNKCSNVSGI